MKSKTREVLVLKANGKLSKQIAADLALNRRTIEWHLNSACKELGAVNTVHAVAIAMRDKLILAGEICCVLFLCWSGLTGDTDARRGPTVRGVSRTVKRESIV